ncbi:zinc ribbon domain-containing protein [Salibacterium salarium]|nr:zinc ribbon domain-containing protein [Salibacterium salarium]
MYCTSCGAENVSGSNYCHNDGTSLHQSRMTASTTKTASFCSGCGESVSPQHNYCASCGTSQMKMEAATSARDTKNSFAEGKETGRSGFNFNKLDWKTSAWTALISVGIALALSLLSFLFINTAVNDSVALPEGEETAISAATNDIFQELETEMGVSLPEPPNIIGFFDYFVLAHMSSPEIVADVTGSYMGDEESVEAEIAINHGFLAFLFIPFIALFIGGMYLAKRTANTNNIDRLQYVGLSSLLYAIVLAFISLFAGFRYSVDESSSDLSVDGSIVLQYSFFSTLLFAFLLGMIPLMFGLLTQAIREKKSIGYNHYFYKAITTGLGMFVGLSAIAFLFLAFGDTFEEWRLNNDFTWSMTVVFFFVMACQLGFTVLSLLHFGSVKVSNEQIVDSYSLFGGTLKDEYLRQTLMDFNFYANIEFYLQLFILVPILVFLYIGYRLSKRSGTFVQPILIFSLIYSVFIAVIAVLGTNSYEFMVQNFAGRSEVMENGVSVRVPFFRLFFFSFLFSSVVTYAGTWIRTVFNEKS